jgi:hypothetical protein
MRRILPRACGCCANASISDVEQQLPDIIRSYNESVGGVNDDTQGYHETLDAILHIDGQSAQRRAGRVFILNLTDIFGDILAQNVERHIAALDHRVVEIAQIEQSAE